MALMVARAGVDVSGRTLMLELEIRRMDLCLPTMSYKTMVKVQLGSGNEKAIYYDNDNTI